MDGLAEYISGLVSRAAPAEVTALADILSGEHGGTVAILAYGSALREAKISETLIDYYLLVDTPASIPGPAVLRGLAALVPPNVYYAERRIGGQDLRCKYAVMTFQQFQDWVSPATANPYLWARFAQPSLLAWARDAASRSVVIDSLCIACRTAYAHGRALSEAEPWQELFSQTYRTELRPESANRAALIVNAERQHYESLSRLMADVQPLSASWAAKRALGKLWSLARLAKAAFTFQGGADYAAWKIARHTGVRIEVTDWQRRHPFLAGIMLLPKLFRLGGLK